MRALTGEEYSHAPRRSSAGPGVSRLLSKQLWLVPLLPCLLKIEYQTQKSEKNKSQLPKLAQTLDHGYDFLLQHFRNSQVLNFNRQFPRNRFPGSRGISSEGNSQDCLGYILGPVGTRLYLLYHSTCQLSPKIIVLLTFCQLQG